MGGARRRSGGAEALGEGAVLLKGFASPDAAELMKALAPVLARAPFRHMVTPGGHRMSVSMTNCGDTGWITDRRGYRYDAVDPLTERPWPPMPAPFRAVAMRAAAAAGFAGFEPDSCLINRYEPTARLSLHQDKNERHFAAPIVSVSLGLPAIFLFGGSRRGDRPRRILLESSDVVVWGGPARLA
ncbi:MAG TPA: DNA oxidative demethylase AlkB, partial [Alphaproteobacteria bacterium]|nr:DNA oxidative demethylase AlkB [Alphaproteobacteria bacterium]